MQAFGQSKKNAVANGTEQDKIFSFSTYQTYWKHTKYFIKYVNEHYPNCTTLKSSKKYVNEWLQSRIKQGLSAWTIQTEAKALGKVYQIKPGDKDYFSPPKRERKNIKRSRGHRIRDTHFSTTNNAELIDFCRATGLRRSELTTLKGKDILTKEEIEMKISQIEKKPGSERTQYESNQLNMLKDSQLFQENYYVYIRNGKGGRERISPIIGEHAEQVIERIKQTPKEEKVWQYVNGNADIHSYRADYATKMYRKYARPIKDIPYDKVNRGTGKKYQSEVYTCRKDESHKKLDRKAMYYCSKALGHNRIAVVAEHYLRGI